MKKSNKIMSLLLAFAMIFTAVVPAFAATDEAADGIVVKKDVVELHVSASKNGKYDGVEQDVKLFVSKSGVKDFTEVQKVTTENGRAKFVLNKSDIIANAEYVIVVGDLTPTTEGGDARNAKLVMADTPWKYVLKTDENGNFIDTKEVFHFTLFIKPQGGSFFTVISLDKNSNKKPGVKFSIHPVKTLQAGDDLHYSLENGTFVVEKGTKLELNGVTDFTTDNFGEKGFSEDEIKSLASQAGYKVGKDKYATTVVAFVVNGEVVAVADVNENSADRLVHLRPVEKAGTRVVVTVEGYDKKYDINDKEALKPIKGAKVELQQNTTKWNGPEEYGNVLEAKVTNEEGKVVFENVSLQSIMRILDADYSKPDGYYTSIHLYNQIAVTEANGYRLPFAKSLYMPEGTANVKYDEATDTYFINFTLYPLGGIHTHRVRGDNRYATSVAAARKAFPEYEGNVIMASGDIYADALVANGLVGLKHQPLVLNGLNKLDKDVAQYLKDVKAKRVTIVGGDTAIAPSVENELEKMGIKTERIFGANRYETSVNVLQHFVKGGEKVEGTSVNEVFLASGENFADALVASVPAAMYARPILLTAKNSLPKVVKDAFENKDYGIKEVTVVGGTGAVSEKVYTDINISEKQRLKGQNRQLTAMAVANAYFTNAGQAIIVDGTKTQFADALSAGQLGWKIKAPILLSQSNTVLGKDLADYLRNNKMTEITIVGGLGSVSDGIQKELEEILAGK